MRSQRKMFKMRLEKYEGLEAMLRMICFILREMGSQWRVLTRGVT